MNLIEKHLANSDHATNMRKINLGHGVNITVATKNVLFDKWLKMNVDSVNRQTKEVIAKGGHIGTYFPHLVSMLPANRTYANVKEIDNTTKTHHVDIFGIQEFDANDVLSLLERLNNGGESNANFSSIEPKDLNGFSKNAEDERTAKGNNDLQVIIYNHDKLEVDHTKSKVVYYAADKPNKRILSVVFRTIKEGIFFRFDNTHVEFGKIQTLIDHSDSTGDLPLIVVGDMNQTEVPAGFDSLPPIVIDESGEISKADYTHINTKGEKVVFDHIWTKNVKD